jgi:hypothetical protein
MIYYPHEANVPSWAGPALGALGYNRNPEKVQALIRKMFEVGIKRVRIPGTVVIPVPLYHALDGKRNEDFVARVEPSALGGKKMAEFILDIIKHPVPVEALTVAPSTSYMAERS